MDFFSHQDQARRNTMLLVGLYAASVILLVASIVILLGVAAPSSILQAPAGARQAAPLSSQWWSQLAQYGDWTSILFIAGSVLTLIVLTSAIKSASLASGGGRMIAKSMGGRKLDPASQEPKERQLQNIVEEMALASGIAVPEVYILDQDQSINAFAAGTTINQAVIGVTRGTMEQLSRDELQGVIAHEYSHIVNGDMRLNLRLIGVLFGILCIQQFGYILMRSGQVRRRSKEGGGIVMIGLGLYLLGLIGYFFGSLIKSAVSRQREFLADASAVQFTRNPLGISGALKKIGGFGSHISNEHATEISHMFFAKGTKGFLSDMFATHPPLKTRIARIDRGFKAADQQSSSRPKASTPPSGHPAMAGFAAGTAQPAAAVLEQVGTTSPEGVQKAHDFVENLPTQLTDAVHNPQLAPLACLAVLIAHQSDEASAQCLRASSEKDRHQLEQLTSIIKPLGVTARLPIIELSVPAIKTLEASIQRQLLEQARKIILADQKVELFEYALYTILRYHLLGDQERKLHKKSSISKPDAIRHVLAALAHSGHGSEVEQRLAYAKGLQVLKLKAKLGVDLPEWNTTSLDSSLARLDQLAYQHKASLLKACAEVIAHDGMVSAEEKELLRAIAERWGCPIPAFL